MLSTTKLNHSTSIIAYHIVLVTKYRNKELKDEEEEIVKEEANKIGEVREIGKDMDDHVHILIQASPTLSPMKIVKSIKEKSSKRIKESNKKWQGWSRGYFLATVSDNSLEAVDEYIKNQGEKRGES